MGCSESRLSSECLAYYQGLTFLTKREINQVYRRYIAIAAANNTPFNEDTIPTTAIPCEKVEEIEELHVNPFRDRVVRAFSTDHVKGMTFEDFLDMMSVFSDSAPREVKVEYAFRIYDFDNNDYISEDDLILVIKRLIGKNEIDEENLKKIVKNILDESDLDDDDMLSFAEFEHVLSKAPDFMNTFRIRI